MTTFILRLIKIIMTAAFALWLGFITITNINQPELNQIEINNTLNMSTLPETVDITYRAITSEDLAVRIFDFIILIQALATACLALGSINLLVYAFKPQPEFHRSKWLASLGFGIALIFFFICLVAFASEYFLTYRSVTPNLSQLEFQGLIHSIFLILALSFLIQPESMPITMKKNNASNNKIASKPTPKPNPPKA
ncbi:DUF2165 family protein [Planctomycetota bacterium]|nr:DUF2165 family protein [Planctomycetota bacterium]